MTRPGNATLEVVEGWYEQIHDFDVHAISFVVLTLAFIMILKTFRSPPLLWPCGAFGAGAGGAVSPGDGAPVADMDMGALVSVDYETSFFVFFLYILDQVFGFLGKVPPVSGFLALERGKYSIFNWAKGKIFHRYSKIFQYSSSPQNTRNIPKKIRNKAPELRRACAEALARDPS